ncbi:MAG TPA: DUF447 domain-containing protein [Gemmatimonadaceae bacterium]|nr:DUF447 domain-containing protein [Gemmatimonadaceae bacterium]
MIIETIITTTDANGVVNIAPMGVEWGEREIVVKPFLETTTFRNLTATREAVIHLIDDALLFARAAVSTVSPADVPIEPARVVRGFVLRDTCSWRELRVRTIDDTPPRSRIVTDVVHHELRREFLGFNRAKHAVLEAAILATRTHLLPAQQIQDEMARLRIIVDKTAGPREQEAMRFLEDRIHEALTPTATPSPGR